MQTVAAYFSEHGADWLQMVADHLAISGIALGVALLIAVPLGIACSRSALAERIATNLAGIMRIIPSLAVLIICVPVLGVGTLPAVVALTVLAIPPVLINTAVAFRDVPADVIEAGRGLGMDARQLFWNVRMPLAFPVAFAGVRTAATEVIASASLAAYIGAGGLGVLIYTGIGAMRTDLLWIGGLSVACLSLLVNRALAAVDHRIRRYEHPRRTP